MWDFINSAEVTQFFDGHPDRVFALILILCATLVLIVVAITRKPSTHHHWHDDRKTIEYLSSGLKPGVYVVDEYRRLFYVPDPLRYFAPAKPPHDQQYIDEYFDLLEKQNYSAAQAVADHAPFYRGKSRPKMSRGKRMRILRRDGFRCQMCGRKATDEEGLKLHVDHKMPVAKGGSNEDDNLWTLCNECNEAKSDTVMEELFDSDKQGDGE